MLPAIDLDDELRSRAQEIHDVEPEWMLATEEAGHGGMVTPR
jgi:hypothetical protein